MLAIVPIHKFANKLPFSALAIGTFIPDFALFYPILSYQFSHSLMGLIAYCLPLGIVVYLLFEWIGKQLLIDISPIYIASRLQDYKTNPVEYSLSNFMRVGLAVVLGSLTHIIWDGFTHSNGVFVALFTWMADDVTVYNVSIAWYKAFQYISSLIGLPILAYIFYKNIKLNKPAKVKRATGYSIAFIIMLLGAPALLGWFYLNQNMSAHLVVAKTIIYSIAIEIIGFFILSFIYYILKTNESSVYKN